MSRLVRHINKLIVKIAGGNFHALDELYKLTGRMLFAMANKYLFDKTYAEDLVSETYLKVATNAKSFDSRQNGLNWIYKILHNAAIDHNRRDINGYVAADMLASRIRANECDIDDWLEQILIKDAIMALSEEEKYVIYLRYWEGLRLKEIAERLNKSTAMAQVIVQKALDKMRECLKKGDE